MSRYVGAITMILLVGLVLTRVLMLKRRGIQAVEFGKLDKRDFLIPPFALFYIYTIFAVAFDLPGVGAQRFFESRIVVWCGAVFCLAGLSLMLWSLISFGRSFRVGIDVEHPDQLITTGAFAHTRNPIYVAFAMVLVGEFLIYPSWIMLAYLVAGFWLFHRQVMREEAYLERHYGLEYTTYRAHVRRYL
jgi:protein-S-isoprenylcysteine O-methyltransferase Ste14